MIRLLAVISCAALVATATATAGVIETQVVTFRGNGVRAKVTLRIDPHAHGTYALRVVLRTRRPGAAAFRPVALAQLDYSRRGFRVSSFVVEPRRNAALVEVAWRRRGIVGTHQQYLLARADSLKAIPPP